MDKRFFLVPEKRLPITTLEDVDLVRLPLGEHIPLKQIKKRSRVAAGALLATHASPNVGDMHAPFDGVVKDITSLFIELEKQVPAPNEKKTEAAASEGPDPAAPVRPVDLSNLEPLELCAQLKKLGIAVRPFTRPCDTFIVNGLNPEPGMLYAQELLAEHQSVLVAGFELLRRLNAAPNFVLALPLDSPGNIPGMETRHVKAIYPISLARPMIRAITGREDTSRVTLVRLHSLFQLGLVARSGLPLTHSVTTAFGKNYFTPLGTPVSALLERSGVPYKDGDSIVLGGHMRGVAISGIRRGIRKEDDAVQLVRKDGMPRLEDNSCINCGACVSVCPMRLRPNMLSRYAEFELYEKCREEYVEVCIECGMCGFVCPTCRPMQQFFRMAKHNLGLSTFQHMLRQ